MLNPYWLLALSLAASPLFAPAATLIEDHYNVFASGNLEGQMGYTQDGGSVDSPIQVTNGQVVIPGGQSVDNQDIYKNFSSEVLASDTGTVAVFQSLKLVFDSVPASTSAFFSALDALDALSFNNFRIAAREGSAPGFVQIGTRVTGQAGYPFAFGDDLALGAPIQLVLEADLVPGQQNDVSKLFILPTATDPETVDFSALTPYAVANYASGTNGDAATLGAFIISQFGSVTVQSAGVRIDQTLIFIPEPSAGMALMGGAFLLRFRRERRA